MGYVIANTPNVQTFGTAAERIISEGYAVTGDYVERADDAGVIYPGGWGCLRFAASLPEATIFEAPSVEYRYSAELDAWVSNGVLTPRSEFVRTIHKYFVDLETNRP